MNYLCSVLGNESLRNRIGAAIACGRLPHALLIDGVPGSGKMTLALDIAAALNCKSGTDTLPCGKCDSCRLIREQSFIDVKVLSRQDGKMTIGVGEIKEYRRDMFLSSTEAEYKVYIIKDAERMTPEAQNALLKVLEEPPSKVVIILLADGTDKILTTIKSRAQYVSMSRFTRDELRAYVTERSDEAAGLLSADPEKLELILTEADGVLGRALELLSPEGSRTVGRARKEINAFIKALGARVGYASLLSATSSFPTARAELAEVLEGIMLALRDMIATKNTEKVKTLFFLSETAAREASENLSTRYLFSVYDLINKAHGDVQKNVGVAALLAELSSQIKLI